MTRRNFIRTALIAGATFNILPGAGRIWKAVRQMPAPPKPIGAPWIDGAIELLSNNGAKVCRIWVDDSGMMRQEFFPASSMA